MASFDENTHTGFGSSASTRISIYEEGLASIDNNIDNNFVKKDGEEISDINKRLKLNRKDISKLTSKHNALFKKLDSVDEYHSKREFDIDEHLSRTDEKLIDAIAEYDNAKNAIGYSYFYYVNTMYKKDTVKMLAINGVKPTIETIKNGTYPIYTNGFIVYRADEQEGSNVLKWVDAVLSERGTKIIEDNGYVAVN